MSDPPAHLVAFRLVMVVVVLLALALLVWQVPWGAVATAIDPMVDGLRRSVWS